MSFNAKTLVLDGYVEVIRFWEQAATQFDKDETKPLYLPIGTKTEASAHMWTFHRVRAAMKAQKDDGARALYSIQLGLYEGEDGRWGLRFRDTSQNLMKGLVLVTADGDPVTDNG